MHLYRLGELTLYSLTDISLSVIWYQLYPFGVQTNLSDFPVYSVIPVFHAHKPPVVPPAVLLL